MTELEKDYKQFQKQRISDLERELKRKDMALNVIQYAFLVLVTAINISILVYTLIISASRYQKMDSITLSTISLKYFNFILPTFLKAAFSILATRI
jgi:hypothetical protein